MATSIDYGSPTQPVAMGWYIPLKIGTSAGQIDPAPPPCWHEESHAIRFIAGAALPPAMHVTISARGA